MRISARQPFIGVEKVAGYQSLMPDPPTSAAALVMGVGRGCVAFG